MKGCNVTWLAAQYVPQKKKGREAETQLYVTDVG